MKITLKKYDKKITYLIIILYYPKKDEFFIHSSKQES